MVQNYSYGILHNFWLGSPLGGAQCDQIGSLLKNIGHKFTYINVAQILHNFLAIWKNWTFQENSNVVILV